MNKTSSKRGCRTARRKSGLDEEKHGSDLPFISEHGLGGLNLVEDVGAIADLENERQLLAESRVARVLHAYLAFQRNR